jgi:two-component system, NarL family, sensor kinase
MTKKLFILLLPFMCIASFAGAQTYMNKDSLLALVSKTKADSTLVLMFYNIGQQYEGNIIDSAKYYYLAARKLSKELGYTEGELKFISNYTYILNIQGKLDSSLLLNKQAIELAGKLTNKKYLASAYANTAASYQYMGKYDSSIANYLAAEKYIIEIGNKGFLITLYSNLANIYQDIEQYEKGLEYAIKSEKIAREENEPNGLSVALVGKAIKLIDLKRFTEAEAALSESMKISKKINNLLVYSTCLINMGDIKIKTQQYGQIKEYAEEALKITETLGDADGHNNALRGLAIYYLHQKDYAKSQQYSLQAFKEASENEHRELMQYKGAYLLSDIALAMQDFDAHHKYRVIADSLEVLINAGELKEKIEDIQTKYETEKKETKLQLQQSTIRQKNTLNSLLIGAGVTLFIISLLGYRTFKQKQKVQQLKITELETEKKLAATEAVLKGEEQERTRLAKDLHDGLGGMLSGIKYSFNTMKGNLIMTPENNQAFERSMDMLDSSIKEMRRVAHNMMPEALVRYGLDVALKDYITEINKSGIVTAVYQSMGMEGANMEQVASITVYRIVQELLNNVMKHAAADRVFVQVLREGEKLIVNVEDNGKGFDTAVTENAGGMGWRNIRSRVELLKGKIDVQSSPGKGASVNIEINGG